MIDPYFVVTAIYDASGWLMQAPRTAAQVRRRYYQAQAYWLIDGDLKSYQRSVIKELAVRYQIHNFNTLHHYIVTRIDQLSSQMPAYACHLVNYHYSKRNSFLHIDRTNSRNTSQIKGYFALYQESSTLLSASPRSSLNYIELLMHEEIIALNRDRFEQRALYNFWDSYPELWQDHALQCNRHGVWVLFSGYIFVQLIQLLALAHKAGFADAHYIRSTLHTLGHMMMHHFDNWQMFWSSYLFGIFHHSHLHEGFNHQQTLESLSGVLFHNLYTLLHHHSSPFLLDDIWPQGSFFKLIEILRHYAKSLRNPLSPYNNYFSQDRTFMYQESLFALITKRVAELQKYLYQQLRKDGYHHILHWPIANTTGNLYAFARENLLSQSGFWQLVQRANLFSKPSELPVWQLDKRHLITNSGIYYSYSLGKKRLHHLQWFANKNYWQAKITTENHLIISYHGHRLLHFQLSENTQKEQHKQIREYAQSAFYALTLILMQHQSSLLLQLEETRIVM